MKKFAILHHDLQFFCDTRAGTFCEAVGKKAAILGVEEGIFEIWIYPFKVLHNLKLNFFVANIQQNIPGERIATQLINRPELTTIVYTHELFTVNQHLLVSHDNAGAIILFDVATYSPLTITINFVPDLIPMWPAGLGGQYSLWLDNPAVYYLAEGSRKYAAIIGSPYGFKKSHTPGHQLPEETMQLAIDVVPNVAKDQFFPLVISASVYGKKAALSTYQKLLRETPKLYKKNYKHYQNLKNETLTVTTPDKNLNQAYEWAKIALDKGFVENEQLGAAVVAGYGISGHTQRPGFAWFFGGDAFLNSFAITGYGDFEKIKQTLAFFCKYQRKDGKIAHELSQSAAFIKWFEEYPYAYYHADTTPYFLVAMHHYVTISGDKNFLLQHWENALRAFNYCVSTDKDNDGLMENSSAGLAAMEVGTMLSRIKVDIYLATIWLKALQCMNELGSIVGDKNIQQQSEQLFKKANTSFQKLFLQPETQKINFAIQEDGSIITEPTVWQSLPYFFNLTDNLSTLKDLAAADMSTDWGVRGVSSKSQHYNPVAYNTGSVWPFTTAYVALAEYQHHRHFNGYQHLMQNAQLTFIDALGWQPELLSGEFYSPLSTAVPHQLFSAAGIVNPLIYGLLGLSGNAIQKQFSFAPHLPTTWNKLVIKNYRLGDDLFNFTLYKNGDILQLESEHQGNTNFQFIFSPALGINPQINEVTINEKNISYTINSNQYDTHCEINTTIGKEPLIIKIRYDSGIELEFPQDIPRIGDRSRGLKIIDYSVSGKTMDMILEGLAGRSYIINFHSRFEVKKIEGGVMVPDHKILIDFENDSNSGFVRKRLHLDFN